MRIFPAFDFTVISRRLLRNPKPGTSNEAKKFRDELAEETRMALCWVVYHVFPIYLKSVTFEKEDGHI